eukprot:TRINITY_DN6675_c0_g1_i2.p1 TRINITY_DN6675_c0_g1~~TRINITY_DN6675_c0_g1_i2.p1  ORF type:complete len:293 (-),score=70.79 TRINITY_DN6675_c0_g1_i2:310-1188(-)
MMQASQKNNFMNNGVGRRSGYGQKGGKKSLKNGRNGRPQGTADAAQWGQAMRSPKPLTEAEAMSVPVFVHGLPNNLCNSMMMEAMLEQAGLEDAIVSVEAWPGFQCGEAVLRLATWEAAHFCLRHFEGCRWDSAVGVTAEIGGQNGDGVYGWADAHQYSVATDVNTVNCRSHGQASSKVSGAGEQKASSDSKVVEADAPKKLPRSRAVLDELKRDDTTPQLAPMASPALTAASTAMPPSPTSLPSSSPFSRSKDRVEHKISWADLTDDEEEEETSFGTETGSAQAGTSDEGF